MKHIATTRNNEAIVVITKQELQNLMYFLNSAEIRFREKENEIIERMCLNTDEEIYGIWKKLANFK